MGTMGCKCGSTLSSSGYPNSIEGYLVSEAAWDREKDALDDLIVGFFTAGLDGRDDWITEHLGAQWVSWPDVDIVHQLVENIQRKIFLDVSECPECRRLHVQDSPGVNRFHPFSPEDRLSERLIARNSELGT